jgi:hypothetical protein
MLLLRREHIDRLFDMLTSNRRFDTPFKTTEYDGGMNFLGTFGEVPVHELGNRSATLCFEWKGEISEPRDTHNIAGMKPNILYDFNGSGRHFDNPDPRYLLPVGSKGLILKHIVINDEDELLRIWRSRLKIYFYRYQILKAIPIVRNILLHKVWQEIYRINEICRNTSFEIAICRHPMEDE